MLLRLYGHASLYKQSTRQVNTAHNGRPKMAWLNPEVKVKPSSPLMLMVAFGDMAWVLNHNGPWPSASGHYGLPQANTMVMPVKY